MSLFCWFKNSTLQDKDDPAKASKHTLNQAMWPTAQVRDSLLASHHLPSKQHAKSATSFDESADLSMLRRS